MNKLLEQYHYQAAEDKFAKTDSTTIPGIAITSMKEIKEAYKEFMQDLLAESQEAY